MVRTREGYYTPAPVPIRPSLEFTISSATTNGARDGAWRSVVLTARRPGMTIASRGGYRAPLK